MQSQQGFVFGNKVVKQGNSFCVRIPANIAKQAKLEEGKNVSIILETNQVFDDDYSTQLFMRICKNIKKLNKMSDEKTRLFIMLQLRYIREVIDYGKKEKDAFINSLRKEYSNQLTDDFLKWRDILDEAYVFTKDGFVVKPKYLKK